MNNMSKSQYGMSMHEAECVFLPTQYLHVNGVFSIEHYYSNIMRCKKIHKCHIVSTYVLYAVVILTKIAFLVLLFACAVTIAHALA